MAELMKFKLSAQDGLQAELTNYGARLMSLFVPDSSGNFTNVNLGFREPEDYFFADEKYFGAIVGRYCNRIAQASFKLDGITYVLQRNLGVHHLHGGINAFHVVMWDARQISQNAIEFGYISADGEEGYPGRLEVKLIYAIIGMELHISMEARTNKKTVVNLTAHPYFNLKGEGNGDILSHELTIRAGYFTPVNESVIPTGELRSVEGTPFDFREARPIGARIDHADEQMRLGHGYDHNFVLDKQEPGLLETAAIIKEPSTGLTMELLTTEPGLQLYTANWLSGKDRGYGGKPYGRREAFCLEPQHFPDSPNHPDFPDTTLEPGRVYQTKTVYKFSY